jgi:hypothetical protein
MDLNEFVRFSDLPTELRLQVWGACFAVEPRLLRLYFYYIQRPRPPIISRINVESRTVALKHYGHFFGSTEPFYFNLSYDLFHFPAYVAQLLRFQVPLFPDLHLITRVSTWVDGTKDVSVAIWPSSGWVALWQLVLKGKLPNVEEVVGIFRPVAVARCFSVFGLEVACVGPDEHITLEASPITWKHWKKNLRNRHLRLAANIKIVKEVRRQLKTCSPGSKFPRVKLMTSRSAMDMKDCKIALRSAGMMEESEKREYSTLARCVMDKLSPPSDSLW